MAKLLSRRRLLHKGFQLCLAGAATAASASAWGEAVVCADLESLDSGQKSIRESLNYTEASPHPAKMCADCGFFQSATGGCGTCAIFSDGPVNAKGYCDSWSEKA